MNLPLLPPPLKYLQPDLPHFQRVTNHCRWRQIVHVTYVIYGTAYKYNCVLLYLPACGKRAPTPTPALQPEAQGCRRTSGRCRDSHRFSQLPFPPTAIDVPIVPSHAPDVLCSGVAGQPVIVFNKAVQPVQLHPMIINV